MEELVELAGFFAAHGVWCVEDGEALIPMLAHIDASGERHLRRFEAESLEDATAAARAALAAGIEEATCGVAVFDGYYTLPGGKTDALFIEGQIFSGKPGALTIVVPYRNASHLMGFAVHRPKFIHAKDASPDTQALSEAFFRGVDSHEKGAAVWSSYLDESQ